jgi:hypothetical protein
LDIIKQEHQALRDVLIRRLGRKAKQRDQVFDIIEKTSSKLIGHLTSDVHSVLSDIDSVRLATPKSLAEMIFAFGYKISQGTVEFDDAVQGSGVQSLLMYRTLHLIDRDYFQKFGWRQAAIWALEEPESSLHASLEASIAAFTSLVARESGTRRDFVAGGTKMLKPIEEGRNTFRAEARSGGASSSAPAVVPIRSNSSSAVTSRR